MLAQNIKSYKTIITKSTVPPGTNQFMSETLIKRCRTLTFNIVSNPEFLREGSAVRDMLFPDRTVIGIQKDDTKSLEIMQALYKGIQAPVFHTSLDGAEMIKYTSNAF